MIYKKRKTFPNFQDLTSNWSIKEGESFQSVWIVYIYAWKNLETPNFN